MSVPVWGVTLSGPLPVVGLVSRYLTNYLMGRSPLPQPRKFLYPVLKRVNSCGISSPFGLLSPAEGQVNYVLLTRSPLSIAAPFDLHVLGTPPAFILSQDQTLRILTRCLVVPRHLATFVLSFDKQTTTFIFSMLLAQHTSLSFGCAVSYHYMVVKVVLLTVFRSHFTARLRLFRRVVSFASMG